MTLTPGELADLGRAIASRNAADDPARLRERVAALERENAALKRENAALRAKPAGRKAAR